MAYRDILEKFDLLFLKSTGLISSIGKGGTSHECAFGD